MAVVKYHDGTEERMIPEKLQKKLKDPVAKAKIKTWEFK